MQTLLGGGELFAVFKVLVDQVSHNVSISISLNDKHRFYVILTGIFVRFDTWQNPNSTHALAFESYIFTLIRISIVCDFI